jgi:hypothetical protein
MTMFGRVSTEQKSSIGVGQQGRGNRLRLNQTERWHAQMQLVG